MSTGALAQQGSKNEKSKDGCDADGQIVFLALALKFNSFCLSLMVKWLGHQWATAVLAHHRLRHDPFGAGWAPDVCVLGGDGAFAGFCKVFGDQQKHKPDERAKQGRDEKPGEAAAAAL